LIIFLKCIQGNEQLSLRLDSEIMLITPTKQTIFIYNFNFNEETSIRFKKFNENNKIASIFQNSEPN